MRLRATIVIDIEAADFVEAAEHQRTIETFVTDLKTTYGQTALDFCERRTPRRGRRLAPRLPEMLPATQRMRPYVD